MVSAPQHICSGAYMELHKSLDSVCDLASFMTFARLLLEDRIDEIQKEAVSPFPPYGPGANGWESWTVEAFLEGALSWAEATNMGLTRGLAPE